MKLKKRNRRKGKFSFRSVRMEITVGRFPQNCIYPFQPKVDFQAERFKLLTIYSVEKGKYK
uniref:Ribosomal protein S16 n=1 Tax=Romanomermis culicivorax TaxID=13658 RepID=A0A915JDR5_ROMCU